jgi:hypothetical protein
MNSSELARALSRVATDAVLDVLPEANSREWEIDQSIRVALLRQLIRAQTDARSARRDAIKHAKWKRQLRVQRRNNKKGGQR